MSLIIVTEFHFTESIDGRGLNAKVIAGFVAIKAGYGIAK